MPASRRTGVLRGKLAEALGEAGFPDDVARKIADWNPYDQNASADWFDPEYMFNVRDGFDIVIGNPPYVRAVSELIRWKAFRTVPPVGRRVGARMVWDAIREDPGSGAGVNGGLPDAVAKARALAEEAFATAAEMLRDPNTPATARVKLIAWIVDRAYGRAPSTGRIGRGLIPYLRPPESTEDAPPAPEPRNPPEGAEAVRGRLWALLGRPALKSTFRG